MPDYERLQSELVEAMRGITARSILELGTGTRETTRRILAAHPKHTCTGSTRVRRCSPPRASHWAGHDLRLDVARVEDPLPDGPFDLIVSALTIHHLDGLEKAALSIRVAELLPPGGRFVLTDLVIPGDPNDAVTPIDPDYDKPSSTWEQLAWLTAAGLIARPRWTHRDLAVLVGDQPTQGSRGRV